MTSPVRGPQSLLPLLLRQSLKSTFCRLPACAVGRDPERNFRRQTDPERMENKSSQPESLSRFATQKELTDVLPRSGDFSGCAASETGP